ncbi:hypothetical protein A2382_02965 [Candidatus Woesebacteria bacterium RIFOXYB1_FULL_38_16]|uniref:Uncharacterized protein n=1 Tax=Candidatus Woesebacteria bacterium RIFOXYB1_FULL_38_16 TaxID=1802538 RepID=A0A1F8CS53_9BACT|nr:MAG: hypothetical protein A2191_04810 [Candidatus Woesebacteria bacterium RIFOXYA1_FULL_38_9]OGM79167.1 MAG: hypothetical protein A2382_02965 [Candidatus Woesebacteria bacterium RIFOXYB1_FULL_38_16]
MERTITIDFFGDSSQSRTVEYARGNYYGSLADIVVVPSLVSDTQCQVLCRDEEISNWVLSQIGNTFFSGTDGPTGKPATMRWLTSNLSPRAFIVTLTKAVLGSQFEPRFLPNAAELKAKQVILKVPCVEIARHYALFGLADDTSDIICVLVDQSYPRIDKGDHLLVSTNTGFLRIIQTLTGGEVVRWNGIAYALTLGFLREEEIIRIINHTQNYQFGW